LSKQDLFVSHEGKILGPFPASEIRQKLRSADLSFTDYVWFSEREEWQFLAQFFSQEFPPPSEPPPGHVSNPEKRLEDRPFSGESFSQEVGISNEPIWFLYRDNTKFGPYRYLELVRLLQTNACGPDDFIWKPGLEDWMRLRQCPEFEEPVLRKMAHLRSFGAEKIFLQRRFPRVPYQSEVILHDEQRVIFGSALSLSEGGAFLEVSKLSHSKGDRIKVHFTPGAVSTPFNCIAEITQVAKGPPSGYNVKFIYLEEDDRKRIAQYADSVVAKG
jgi:hypothetical protein